MTHFPKIREEPITPQMVRAASARFRKSVDRLPKIVPNAIGLRIVEEAIPAAEVQ